MSLLQLIVATGEKGLRLDQFLAARTSLSRRAARTVISSGVVSCNSRPIRIQSREMAACDVVEIRGEANEFGSPLPYSFAPPELLLTTTWLVAANKPAGVLSQSSEVDDGTAPFDQRVAMELSRKAGRPAYCRMVHRLDRVTSGVALFATRPQAHKPLIKAWSSDRVVRTYLALVEGTPDFTESHLQWPIARDPDHRWRFRCHDSGQTAQTNVRVVDDGDGHTLVMCRLVTGRTHQVRVHLARAGHPVVGDRLYGASPTAGVNRPLLHALAIRLPDPEKGVELEVTAPIPADMADLLKSSEAVEQALANPSEPWPTTGDKQ